LTTRPTGTVTFLFTDIEGSSRLWRDEPAAMSEALARHDHIVRSAIESHHGYVFSTGGDGFAAAFTRAGDAVEAAAEAQAGLRAEPWPAPIVIRVRMALHTGEVEERDGDYFGTPVNVTARLMALAASEQVLLSAVTAGLVDPQTGLEDLGEQWIADAGRSWRVFALSGSGLSTRPLAETPTDPEDRRPSPAGVTYTFGPIQLDTASVEVRNENGVVPVEPQVFDVLRHLIDHRDRVVTKEELLDEVWGDRFVSESALTTRIKTVRRAVGDDGRRQEIIRTVHGRGYQFVAPVTVEEHLAPTLDGPDAPPSGLPSVSRPLIARERESAEINELLETNRLVTVVGPGGVGKTRLATDIGRMWERARTDRVVFVQLSPVSDPELVGSAMSDAVGLRYRTGADALPAMREAFRGISALIILDNFEHVAASAPLVAEMIESIPGVRFLVTSRERLHLIHEQVFELEPLATHLDGGTRDQAQMTPAPAIALFEQAARTTTPRFEVTPDNLADVAAICEQLDGLPLAVELAAAQLRYLPLPYLRTHLEANAASLTDAAHDRPDRHHTVRDTVAWSYALLSPSQQRLFTYLSVFVGGWSLEGAQAVADDDVDVLKVLAALVDKSLIRPIEGVHDEPRWNMLHVIRDYAAETLDLSENEANRRHSEFVVAMTEAADVTRNRVTSDRWVDDLLAEFANIGAALEWTFDHGEPLLGCRIVAGLNLWWYRSTRHSEGRRWVARALEHLEGLEPAIAARVHVAAGYLAYGDREMDRARHHFEEAISAVSDGDDSQARVLSLCGLAGASIGRPDEYEHASGVIEEGIEQARLLDNRAVLAHGLNVMGELFRSNGNLDRAERAYREALEINEELGDRHYEAINRANLGHVALARGDLEGALPYVRSALSLSRELGSRTMVAWSVSEQALARQMMGQQELAARLIGGSESALQYLGVRRGPADQPVHERTRAMLVADLGQARFEELVREGRELTLDQAVDLALEGL
jgi:predicted ATPase/class 3 adenylate cyclase/DNA-binding winged helix-turn-helix (wHTH) protein